jgi:hypothetical protein
MSIARAVTLQCSCCICNRVAHTSYTAKHMQPQLQASAAERVVGLGSQASFHSGMSVVTAAGCGIEKHSRCTLWRPLERTLPVPVAQQHNSDAKGAGGSHLGGLQEGPRTREAVAQLVPELRRCKRLHRKGCVPQLAAVVPLHTVDETRSLNVVYCC